MIEIILNFVVTVCISAVVGIFVGVFMLRVCGTSWADIWGVMTIDLGSL